MQTGAGAFADAKRPALGRTIAEFLHFYIPLAIQGISMSLTYPLVGSVVSHGPLGPDEYAVFAQSQGLMFLVGSVGAGMITTGMIFARSRTGMRNYVRLSRLMGLVAALLQCLCCVPPFSGLVFGRMYDLEGELFAVGRNTLLLAIPMNYTFFVRNPYLATLFSEKRTDVATFATFFRIGLTWIGSVSLVKLGLVGWQWGLALSTFAVFLESFLFWIFSRKFIAVLDDAPGKEIASTLKQGLFTLPLSLGGAMMNLSTVVNAYFLTETPDPVLSRAIHYIALGVINPLTNASARLQSLTVAFNPDKYGHRRVMGFVVAIGACVACVSFLMQIPSLANSYFHGVQNLDSEGVSCAMKAMVVGAPIPFLMALRGHAEGLAALRRRPNLTLSSQIAYLATLVVVFQLLIRFAPLPGYKMSIASIACSQLAAFLTLRFALWRVSK